LFKVVDYLKSTTLNNDFKKKIKSYGWKKIGLPVSDGIAKSFVKTWKCHVWRVSEVGFQPKCSRVGMAYPQISSGKFFFYLIHQFHGENSLFSICFCQPWMVAIIFFSLRFHLDFCKRINDEILLRGEEKSVNFWNPFIFFWSATKAKIKIQIWLKFPFNFFNLFKSWLDFKHDIIFWTSNPLLNLQLRSYLASCCCHKVSQRRFLGNVAALK